jgi:hypothetical protein
MKFKKDDDLITGVFVFLGIIAIVTSVLIIFLKIHFLVSVMLAWFGVILIIIGFTVCDNTKDRKIQQELELVDKKKKAQIPTFFGLIVDGDEESFIEQLKKIFNVDKIEKSYILSNFDFFGSTTAKLDIVENFGLIETVILKGDNNFVNYKTIEEKLFIKFKEKNYPIGKRNKEGGLTYRFDNYTLGLLPISSFEGEAISGFKFVIVNEDNLKINEKFKKERIDNSINNGINII